MTLEFRSDILDLLRITERMRIMRFEPGEMPIRRKSSSQSLILQMIYHWGPIKRPDIAQMLDLTRPTITTAVKAMIEQGIVREISDPGEQTAALGRRAYPVEIVPDSRYFLGLELRKDCRAACITDYLGRILCREADGEACQDYEGSIQSACRLIRSLLKHSGLGWEQLRGIGLCVPGLVDREQGILQTHPAYHWSGKPIRRDLMEALPYERPVAVVNNVCARAMAVQMFRREPLKGQSFAYLFVSTGIACPLMLNDFSLRDSVVGIGEVGHTVMDPAGAGESGSLEAFSSDQAVIARCREAMEAGEAPVLAQLCAGKPVTMERILEAQTRGDRAVDRILQKAVHILGLAVTNVCNFACPGTMFLEGHLFAHPENRKLLQEVVDRNLYSAAYAHTELVFREPDLYGGAVGAAAAAVSADLEGYGGPGSRSL